MHDPAGQEGKRAGDDQSDDAADPATRFAIHARKPTSSSMAPDHAISGGRPPRARLGWRMMETGTL